MDNSPEFIKWVNEEYDRVFGTYIVETVSLPQALALGTAAIVIKNPVVSRRLWGAK